MAKHADRDRVEARTGAELSPRGAAGGRGSDRRRRRPGACERNGARKHLLLDHPETLEHLVPRPCCSRHELLTQLVAAACSPRRRRATCHERDERRLFDGGLGGIVEHFQSAGPVFPLGAVNTNHVPIPSPSPLPCPWAPPEGRGCRCGLASQHAEPLRVDERLHPRRAGPWRHRCGRRAAPGSSPPA